MNSAVHLELWLATLADCEMHTICTITQSTPSRAYVKQCAAKYPVLWSSEDYGFKDSVISIAELAPKLENGAWWVTATGPGYGIDYVMGGKPGPPGEESNGSDAFKAQWMSYPELLTALMSTADENPWSIDL